MRKVGRAPSARRVHPPAGYAAPQAGSAGKGQAHARADRGGPPGSLLLVSLAKQLDDLRLRGLVRVREAAGVLHGVVRKRLEILGLGPQLLDIRRDVELFVQAFDGRQHRGNGLAFVLPDFGEAHRVCDVDKKLRHVLGVVRLHDGEEHRVADTVRRVVKAAELVCHGVHVAQAGGIESHARKKFGVRHHVPGLHVLAVLHRLRQERGDKLDGVQRVGVGNGVGRGAHVGLDGVRQCVHASGRGQAFGHADHEQRVVHRQRGREAPIHEGHLHVALVVGDNAESRHLRRRACRGVDRHHGQHRLGALVHPLVVPDASAVGA
mmetsp:Transcript_42369/g.128067  ORF Transcript_42369/g.128067 Transcript_42369/m.128067 type:complete len:321 (+) Transcript_42369:135-1097(+)